MVSSFCFCVAVCYLPPADTCKPVDSEVFFQNLLRQTYCYQRKGKVFICGDMNARMGLNSDYIEGVDLVKARSVIDCGENKHGDSFANFLSDVNFCMLNGRFSENEFTCISTTGKSVVDYMCVPYEELDYVSDFKILPMTSIINGTAHIPESIPDHSLLYCDFKTSLNLNIETNANKVSPKFNVKSMPHDFLSTAEIRHDVMQTIARIENYIIAENDIQHAYDEFESLIKTEMKDKLSTHKSHVGTKRRKYKPYWNEELGSLWKKVCETEKIWLRFTGHSSKKRTLKEDYCHKRKTFDRLNRKYKRQYQLQQQQTLEDKLSNMNQKDFWKSIGKIGIANERKRAIPLAVVDNCGNVTNDKSNVLNIWKNDFETLFKRNEDINDHLDTTICNTEIDVSALNEAISREEVVKAVIHAKLRKAAGIDDIPAEVLKNEAAIDLLFKIISGCFNLGKNKIAADVVENVGHAQMKQKLNFDKRHNVIQNEFCTGDLVLLRNLKRKKALGMQKWLGPYKIYDIPRLSTITLMDSNEKIVGKYRQNNVKKYYEPETMLEEDSSEKPDKDDEIEENINMKNDEQDENNNELDDESIFLTQSTFQQSDATFDLEVDDLMSFPSPVLDSGDDTACASNGQPRRQCVG
ncbi:Hypothetical predicted protein [Mytilus galloprovincialis]|uniref:Endonuclease/exonuclease/phosphatase domain-containing protein n=1 Tax=Mytilus galloprovincialis TaxID=29158 RepID=A0A8B6EQK4_MYTGA|nr:Hypothetical predicted protein [Mytilus galloprovincialis]